MKIVNAFAGHRALTADVERTDRVDLSCVRVPNDHAILLLDAGIGRRWLHAAELEWRPPVLVEVRQDRRGLHSLRWKSQWRLGTNRAGRFGHVGAVFRQQKARNTVISARARD